MKFSVFSKTPKNCLNFSRVNRRSAVEFEKRSKDASFDTSSTTVPCDAQRQCERTLVVMTSFWHSWTERYSQQVSTCDGDGHRCAHNCEGIVGYEDASSLAALHQCTSGPSLPKP